MSLTRPQHPSGGPLPPAPHGGDPGPSRAGGEAARGGHRTPTAPTPDPSPGLPAAAGGSPSSTPGSGRCPRGDRDRDRDGAGGCGGLRGAAHDRGNARLLPGPPHVRRGSAARGRAGGLHPARTPAPQHRHPPAGTPRQCRENGARGGRAAGQGEPPPSPHPPRLLTKAAPRPLQYHPGPAPQISPGPVLGPGAGLRRAGGAPAAAAAAARSPSAAAIGSRLSPLCILRDFFCIGNWQRLGTRLQIPDNPRLNIKSISSLGRVFTYVTP